MMINKFFSKKRKEHPKEDGKYSYSQCGEDLIIDFLLQNYLGIINPSYLDIGAHHATKISNTYLFYQKGGSGVCVEADPLLNDAIKTVRQRDKCINIGIGPDRQEPIDFYIMSSKTLNTFSKKEAERYATYNNKLIEDVIKIPIETINNVIQSNFSSHPNIISLDVEGLDYDILNSFDFSRWRPEVFCIETLTYVEDNTEEKLTNIIELMKGKSYFVYADTFINTIFVDNEAWSRR